MRARPMLSLASVVAAAGILCLAAACGGSDSSGGTTSGAAGSGTAGSGTAGSGTAGSGTAGSATAGAAGAPLPKTFGETACFKCGGTECAAEYAACNADAECKAYIDCIGACPPKSASEADAACQAACKTPTMSAGQAAVGAFGTCFKAKVDDETSPCKVACGQ